MAFSFQGTGGGFGGGGGSPMQAGGSSQGQPGQSQMGPDLEEIQTEALGFLSVNGDSKLKLLPSPWPSDSLPPPTSSLLSVASGRGLLAAAGPDTLVISSTDSVRQAFSVDTGIATTKPFTPQLSIPLQTRVSQVAFSADESALVISSENGGGLAVYDVNGLTRGNTQPVFEISTNGISLRQMAPSPTKEKAELFALVTSDGKLLIASLGKKELVDGPNGKVMKEGVSCVAWSNKGTALVAGLGDGSAYQMRAEGAAMADIPRPPALPDGDRHVTSIAWLENNVFLLGFNAPAEMDGAAQGADFYLVTRDPSTNPPLYGFQKTPEVCAPYGMERNPPSQFIVRLRNFPPSLLDLLIVSQTTSTDVSLLTRSKDPLEKGRDVTKITNVFTATTLGNDSFRAELPMPVIAEGIATSTIGAALDLSSKDKIKQPIPGEEIEESPYPLPNYMILNNEGILSSWWIMYADSVRQGTVYPGLTVAGGTEQKPSGAEPSPAAPFGQSTFGRTSQPTPATNAFGVAAFGTTAAPAQSTGTFGSASPLGGTKPAWASGGGFSTTPASSAFGKPAFGSPTAPGAGRAPAFGSSTTLGSGTAPAFGAAGGLGSRSSPWASKTPGSSTGGAAFGQAGGIGGQSAFGASTGNTPASGGGFASFANKSGFGGIAANQPATFGSFASAEESAFAKAGSGTFGQTPAANATSFGSSMDTSFGAPPKPMFGQGAAKATSPWVSGSAGDFKVEPSFKPDANVDREPKPTPGGGSFGFGGLGDLLNQPEISATPASKEESMDEGAGEGQGNVPPSSEGSGSMFGTVSLPKSTPPLFSTETPKSETPAAAPLFRIGSKSQPDKTPETPTFGSQGFLDKTTEPTSLFVAHPEPEKTSKAAPLFGTEPQPEQTPAKVEASVPTSIFSSTPKASPIQETSSHTPASPKIKTEPPSDDDLTPAATPSRQYEEPLPPDSISKTEHTAGDISASSSDIRSQPDDAPLPPDFLSTKKSATEDQPPLPDDSGEEDGESDFDESGEDVTKEISPTDEQTTSSLKFSPESSFGTTDRSPLGGSFTKVNAPGLGQQPRPLFGEVSRDSIPVFPPPSKQQESPRSPSPIRSALPPNILRPESARSVSAPIRAPSIIPQRIQKLGRSPLGRDPTPEEARAAEFEQRRVADEKSRQAAEQEHLSDDEDEQLRAELSAEIDPSRNLDLFCYHGEYTKDAGKPGIPGQIELLYRDINSMIDTLGINARSLESWMRWQMENYQEVDDIEISRLDIPDDDWCMDQVSELSIIESNLFNKLEAGRLHGMQPKIEQCIEMSRMCEKLYGKTKAIRNTIDAYSDPALLSGPLSAEQSSIQHDLRKASKDVQTLLAEAEQSISVLRAQISAVASADGTSAHSSRRPTVEAVTTTIQKMTGMAEKRSIDIDLLETQIRRLDIISESQPQAEYPLLKNSSARRSVSRDASPFQTPPRAIADKRRSLYQTPNSSKTTGSQYYTPESTPSKHRTSVRSNGHLNGFRSSTKEDTPSRRLQKVTVDEEIPDHEKIRFREKLRRRKEVVSVIKQVLEEAFGGNGLLPSVER